MATATAGGRERRQERLNERLRGAQRANVQDESFHLNIDGLESSSPSRVAPSSSTRKRKHGDAPASRENSSPARRSTRSATKDPSVAEQGAETRGAGSDIGNASSGRKTRTPSSLASAVRRPADTGPDELEMPSEPPSAPSPPRTAMSTAMLEEIEESPLHAPGSGRRRTIPLGSTLSSATRLGSVLSADNGSAPSSSPLVRKVRRSDVAPSVPSRLSLRPASTVGGDENVDELSPNGPGVRRPAEAPRSSPLSVHEAERTAEGEVAGNVPRSEDEAERVGATETAKSPRRKRPRRSLRNSSPELGSGSDGCAQQTEPVPSQKRPRRARSPVRQKEPACKPRSRAQQARQKAPGSTMMAKKRDKGADDDGADDGADDGTDNDGGGIEITVQRFVNNKRRDGDDDVDPLQCVIPFANRSGETVVDVFAQVCNEVIDVTLKQFQQLLARADDAAKKKEYRIKIRAVEAYREELRSRLLLHAIHLNHWYSLRKQAREAQKEKLALRQEILRLRGEREQVALRMDAVRIKHEADDKELTFRLNTSTLMQEIELAVDQGQAAPELATAERKRADIANLDLLAAQVADQASSASSTGGLLRRVQEFNGLLERAAAALESR
ncbi:hypothetical protein DCS_04316 [Drechmeria coniospora]|uniref:Inner kinetochore subunit AME1 domain-containing protein n=1 Tax=Drechmeria coniospora TaxID=98403 RepID=A0A151GJP7_DRECN|nr:hypothetical protein DCS_04316 [Drechmeria coniospora]KYK57308.1 hypothetical protein DCS_04316 [Drechmeria coniospora]